MQDCKHCDKESNTALSRQAEYNCKRCDEKFCVNCAHDKLRYSERETPTCEKCFTSPKCLSCENPVPWEHASHFGFDLWSQFGSSDNDWFEKSEHHHCSDECYMAQKKRRREAAVAQGADADMYYYVENTRVYNLREWYENVRFK